MKCVGITEIPAAAMLPLMEQNKRRFVVAVGRTLDHRTAPLFRALVLISMPLIKVVGFLFAGLPSLCKRQTCESRKSRLIVLLVWKKCDFSLASQTPADPGEFKQEWLRTWTALKCFSPLSGFPALMFFHFCCFIFSLLVSGHGRQRRKSFKATILRIYSVALF